MYDVIFLSRTIPNSMDVEVRGKMSNTMDDAAIVWQKHIVGGLEQNLGFPVKLLNFLPIKSFPQNYRDAFIKRSFFSHIEGAQDVNLPFCNIKYVKRLFQGHSLYREIKKWAATDNGNKKIIICYSLYPEYLRAIEIAKHICPDISTVAIVLDLPEYSVLTNRMTTYTKVFLRWNKNQFEKRKEQIDYYVLLTEPMVKALDISKPYCIIEGICTRNIIASQKDNESGRQIFYAGTLHERFGILHLIEAFELIDNPNYRLVICGYGDSEYLVRSAASVDKRIEFMGQLHRDDVLTLMKKSDLIVNPRGNFEEFTKYSFPSKNLEALSTGIPFVGYKLDGIPNEYDDYINYPIDSSSKELANLIVKICDDTAGEYWERASRAQKWVLNKKNPEVQARKLLNLLNKSKEE